MYISQFMKNELLVFSYDVLAGDASAAVFVEHFNNMTGECCATYEQCVEMLEDDDL